MSLGTSFVLMADYSINNKILTGANAMYDGINNPFVFACRTNGSLVWDNFRKNRNLSFKNCDEILVHHKIGTSMMMWQPLKESLPVSSSFSELHINNDKSDYAGLIDSTLALFYYSSKDMMQENSNPLFITGGPSKSQEIIKRVAAFWNRPVIKIKSTGASLGAAISAYISYNLWNGQHKENIISNLYNNVVSQILHAQDVYVAPERDIERAKSHIKNIVEEFQQLK